MLAEYRARSQITLPKAIVDKVGLSVGDMLEITAKDGGIFLAPVVGLPKYEQDEMTHEDYMKRLDELFGDDPTFVRPPEIPAEYDSPRETIE